jgi:hypothetical protein
MGAEQVSEISLFLNIIQKIEKELRLNFVIDTICYANVESHFPLF